jgi:hypothetical protein
MFLYGCDKPSSNEASWACGGNACSGASTILFAWGLNAPPLELPQGNFYWLFINKIKIYK